jgi:hypothetical protein
MTTSFSLNWMELEDGSESTRQTESTRQIGRADHVRTCDEIAGHAR